MKTKYYDNILQLKYDAELCQEVECTEEENQQYLEMLNQKKELPYNIKRCEDSLGIKTGKFVKVLPLELSVEQIREYCTLQQTKDIHTIKNCAVFFVVFTCVSLVLSLLLLLLKL